MKRYNSKRPAAISFAALIYGAVMMGIISFGCGDSAVNDSTQNPVLSSSGKAVSESYKDSTLIKLDLAIRFKSTNISSSCFMEGSNGNSFRHIVQFEKDLKPGDELDLHELQQSGIFALYVNSNGRFTISNPDGMSVSTKSLLFEKCEFIDLKIKNTESNSIHVAGFVAGE